MKADPHHPESVSRASTVSLLRLYAAILAELLSRGVIRSRNAPAGDLAEHLALIVYGGKLAPPSAKSWDLRSSDDRLVQVKCRVASPGQAGNYSFFRSWDFDACVFVRFDPATYDITSAIEVPAAAVQALARASTHVNGSRIQLSDDLMLLDGSVNRTSDFRKALLTLG